MTIDKNLLDTIDHVAICVVDVKAAVEWYTRTFKCEVCYQDDTWAMLQFNNVKLAFVIAEQHPPHIALFSPDAEAFGKLKTHRDGTRSVYIQDPSGNAVEILATD
ncbi:MAG: VOC family protein [Acidobacteriota bacterium]|nr:VOC family protein [Blastocatellia bacterium]MDW8240816.1 VOC family protein [Acidobacteriota bacterium]